jgi:hypothetical protein
MCRSSAAWPTRRTPSSRPDELSLRTKNAGGACLAISRIIARRGRRESLFKIMNDFWLPPSQRDGPKDLGGSFFRPAQVGVHSVTLRVIGRTTLREQRCTFLYCASPCAFGGRGALSPPPLDIAICRTHAYSGFSPSQKDGLGSGDSVARAEVFSRLPQANRRDTH